MVAKNDTPNGKPEPSAQAELSKALRESDGAVQDLYKDVEALCGGAGALLMQESSTSKSEILRLLEMVRSRVESCMNDVNVMAEERGCNFKDSSHG